MKKNLVAMAVLLTALNGCSKQEPVELNLDGLKNMTYVGVVEQDPVTLKDGVWEGEPAVAGGASRPSVRFVRDFQVMGDLDGDGIEEAAILLAAGSGGTGENIYLAVVGLEEGALKNLGTVLVGDRAQVRKAGIGEGRVFLDLLRAGPEDALCCPGELVMQAWRFEGGVLTPTGAASAPRRLNFEAIADSEWVLRWWSIEEEMPADPVVTLTYSPGRLGGSSGCNNWFTAPEVGDKPGEFTVGPVGGTKMMCPDDVMAVEQRFLTQLSGAKKFGFLAGQLAVTYETDGASGVMLFSGRKAE